MISDKENIQQQIFKSAIDEATNIVRRNMNKWADKLPDVANAGVYFVFGDDDLNHFRSWRVGFGIGIQWLLFQHTGDDAYRRKAEAMLGTLVKMPFTPDQCQGVLYLPSCIAALKFGSYPAAAETALGAADVLMKQYSEKGGYFRAFKQYENFVIDTAFNSVILHWASKYTGDPSYYEAAESQLKAIMKYSVRADGSTYHQYWFDPDGNPIEGTTAQGFKDSTCWSRGQTWAMLGFALHYRFTRRREYLEVFKKLASYYYSHLRSDLIPCWDLCFTDSRQPTDSSSAAIAACAVLEMAELLPKDRDIAAFKESAIASVCSLINSYSVAYDDYIDCLLTGASDNVLRYRSNESVIYGDYFYLEALMRLIDSKKFDALWQ